MTNETLARAPRSPRTTARWTSSPTRPGSIFAQGWTPELQKLVGGRQDAAGLLKAVQAEYEKLRARGDDRRRRGRPGAGAIAIARRDARRRPSPADPVAQGVRRQTVVGWLFVLPAL